MANGKAMRSVFEGQIMNGKQYSAALQLSTEAALKSKDISLPEIIGELHLAIIQVERLAYQHAVSQRLQEERNGVVETAGGILLPKFKA